MWPLIRIEIRSEIAQRTSRTSAAQLPVATRATHVICRAASPLLKPLENRRDWKNEALLVRPVDALFLGDGISQDFLDGAWRDRYCAPIIEALGAAGAASLLMQPGTQRLPRERKTYAVQWIDDWGRLAARVKRARNVDLPAYHEVRQFLRERNLDFPQLELPALERWGVRVAEMARLFDRILARTRPRIGFVVSYYWDIGYAFNIACRRRAILSVDIQHGAQDGRHEAYNLWSSVPATGYPVMPAIFWNWSEQDAQAVQAWAGRLPDPWHRGVWGGHPQLAAWLDNSAPQIDKFDAMIASLKQRSNGTFDILVALQDVGSYGAVWDRLADLILSCPPSWRWWLRRHPSPAYNHGAGIKRLIELDKPNVIVQDASALPLPAVLRNVDAVLSLMSGTAVEASYFGHKPIFLSEEARDLFSAIFEADKALVITEMKALEQHLTALEQAGRQQPRAYSAPDLKETVRTLLAMAQTYGRLASAAP